MLDNSAAKSFFVIYLLFRMYFFSVSFNYSNHLCFRDIFLLIIFWILILDIVNMKKYEYYDKSISRFQNNTSLSIVFSNVWFNYTSSLVTYGFYIFVRWMALVLKTVVYQKSHWKNHAAWKTLNIFARMYIFDVLFLYGISRACKKLTLISIDYE